MILRIIVWVMRCLCIAEIQPTRRKNHEDASLITPNLSATSLGGTIIYSTYAQYTLLTLSLYVLMMASFCNLQPWVALRPCIGWMIVCKQIPHFKQKLYAQCWCFCGVCGHFRSESRAKLIPPLPRQENLKCKMNVKNIW